MIPPMFRKLAKAAINRLPFPLLYEAFYQSGRRLGVKSYEIRGEYGDAFGPFYDQTITKHYLRSGQWSPAIVGILREFFDQSAGGTFYDIGANIGLVTLAVSQNPKVQCIAFEPDPNNQDAECGGSGQDRRASVSPRPVQQRRSSPCGRWRYLGQDDAPR